MTHRSPQPLSPRRITPKAAMGCVGAVAVLALCLLSGATSWLTLATQSAPPPSTVVVAQATPTLDMTPSPISTALPSRTPTFTVAAQATETATSPPAVVDTPTVTNTSRPVQPTSPPARATSPPTPVVIRPTPTPTYNYKDIPPIPGPLSLPMGSPEYGMQAFLWWRTDWMLRDERLVKAAGFSWIKQNFGWRDIEPKKGQFDWTRPDRIVLSMNEIGMDLVVRLDFQPPWARSGCTDQGPPSNLQDYTNFVSAVASRYKGRIRAYEIWNEPNLAREWCDQAPNAAQYVAMLKAAYSAIKQADANAWVISAGLSPTTRNDKVARPDVYFLQEMYDAGAAKYFDLLGVHGAGYRAPPEADPGDVARDPNLANPGDFQAGVPEELRRIYCFRHTEDLRAIMLKNGDVKKQVALLEFGWTNDNRPNSPYAWHSIKTEETKADYFVRAYKYAVANWKPWIGLMSLIYVSDPNWTQNDEQYWWSITNPDGSVREAYRRLTAMPKIIN